MNNKLFFGFLLFIYCYQFSFSQTDKDSLYLKINLRFRENLLELNKNYISKIDTLQISLMKFYLSEIEIEYNDKSKFFLQKKYHLIDIENSKSLQIPLTEKNKKIISSINFKIGIDSLASVSGANSGDLDPQKGMYWAWQSGYINMKIEGKSNSCKSRKNAFQFHVGGYLQPNYALRKVNLNLPTIRQFANIHNNINLIVDLSQIFDIISLQQNNSIMIPGQQALMLADLSKNMFRLE